MSKGKIKWYDEVKGYGFIQPEKGKDVFLHRSSLVNPYADLQPEQEVTYEVQESEKGLVAVNVEVVE
jgi:CspA family cold shock protein